jgi:fermentation-respiration switch protein FrsA (DUF1100 family)
MKQILFWGTVSALMMVFGQACARLQPEQQEVKMEQLSGRSYTTFRVGENVDLYKVVFLNQLKMELAGHLFIPKNLDLNVKNSAIIVGHPMGAVKEQSADVYASNMADRGFITLAVDLPFWGESEGSPRNTVVPDLYTETFSAAVDFLGTRPFVDRDRIGIIGICGSGGFVISAAKIDPRLKAIATIVMVDMGTASRNWFSGNLTDSAQQRYVEFSGGKVQYTGGARSTKSTQIPILSNVNFLNSTARQEANTRRKAVHQKRQRIRH